MPGDPDDDQARYIEATIKGVRVGCIYLPNGNPVDTEKFPYKLDWMDRLHRRMSATRYCRRKCPSSLGGDYNCCPTDRDVYDPEGFRQRRALPARNPPAGSAPLINLGLTEAWRALHSEIAYSYWDYQRGRWHRDEGLRIDHFLLSPQAADRLTACEIDRNPRGKQKASDHTPVWVDLEIE